MFEVSKSWLTAKAKRLEKTLLKAHGKSLSWISILQKFNACVIEVQIDTGIHIIDKNKLNEICKEIEKKYTEDGK